MSKCCSFLCELLPLMWIFSHWKSWSKKSLWKKDSFACPLARPLHCWRGWSISFSKDVFLPLKAFTRNWLLSQQHWRITMNVEEPLLESGHHEFTLFLFWKCAYPMSKEKKMIDRQEFFVSVCPLLPEFLWQHHTHSRPGWCEHCEQGMDYSSKIFCWAISIFCHFEK